ncbi:MAG TPA: rhodanese-like domain-containing protein [Spirochaetota bacterium]|nr:rhodanese-like domain-containing protein [Spirochaetota bacterium]HPJ33703.1 rhodanese-like domain-containing protein [Spirochaetota bacterium]
MKRVIPIAVFFQLISCGFTDYVTPAELNDMMSSERLLIIDLRNPHKFADGHIKGAVNIEYHNATFVRDIKKLDKDSPVVIYCGVGIKSDAAADIMKQQGFRNVKILKDGYSSWLSMGFKGER